MKNVDIYKQYFSAECTFNGVKRRGAVVWLNAESDSGIIRYEVGVTFFPHKDDEDFAISYDASFNSFLVVCKTLKTYVLCDFLYLFRTPSFSWL